MGWERTSLPLDKARAFAESCLHFSKCCTKRVLGIGWRSALVLVHH